MTLAPCSPGATTTARARVSSLLRDTIAKLVQLRDRSAIPALEHAVARGKVNACLRASAEHAIRTLGAN